MEMSRWHRRQIHLQPEVAKKALGGQQEKASRAERNQRRKKAFTKGERERQNPTLEGRVRGTPREIEEKEGKQMVAIDREICRRKKREREELEGEGKVLEFRLVANWGHYFLNFWQGKLRDRRTASLEPRSSAIFEGTKKVWHNWGRGGGLEGEKRSLKKAKDSKHELCRDPRTQEDFRYVKKSTGFRKRLTKAEKRQGRKNRELLWKWREKRNQRRRAWHTHTEGGAVHQMGGGSKIKTLSSYEEI